MIKQVSVNLPKYIKKDMGIDRVEIPDENSGNKTRKVASDGTILLEDETDYDTTD